MSGIQSESIHGHELGNGNGGQTLSNGGSALLANEHLGGGSSLNLVNGNVQLGATAMFNLAKIAAEQKPLVAISSASLNASVSQHLIVQTSISQANSISVNPTVQTLPIASSGPVLVTAVANPPSVRPTIIQQHTAMGVANNPIRIQQQAPQQILIPRNTISLPPGVTLPAGTVLMQNDKGQLMFVSRAPAPQFQVRPPKPQQQPAFFSQQPSSDVATMQQLQAGQMISGIRPGAIMAQQGSTQVLVRPGSITNTSMRVQVPATAVVQKQIMPQPSGDRNREEIRKCKNFLETLIRLSSQQPPEILTNVKNLIQGLLDGSVTPDSFTTRLQKELNSQKQPGLAAFLRKSLPELRAAINRNELTIEGLGLRVTAINHQMGTAAAAAGTPIIQVPATAVIRPGSKLTAEQVGAIQRAQPQSLQQRPLLPQHLKGFTGTTAALAAPGMQVNSALQREPSPAPKKQRLDLKDDDDINDVATMGGVNLTEESRNILAVAAETSSQLRSCKDETFLAHTPLAQRIRQCALKKGLHDIAPDVVDIISHACEEHLRLITERVSMAAEHRLGLYKVDKRFEQDSDVRSQMKFLEELDRLEKKRHEDQEREMLLRAAKSRSKNEDPEQAKLKQKAKELQQQELEEVMQREANITALAAIGPRRKRKMEDSPGAPSGANLAEISNSANNQIFQRPRLKRVNLRDLWFVLEQDESANKSHILYKSFLR